MKHCFLGVIEQGPTVPFRGKYRALTFNSDITDQCFQRVTCSVTAAHLQLSLKF